MPHKKDAFSSRVRYFSEIAPAEGSKTSDVQILKTGRWNHPVYGDFSVTASDLDLFVQNFNDKVRGTDLCVDVNHDWEHKAVGWFRKVERRGEALFATIEWTDAGLDLINSKTYRYFSPELFFSYRDEETGRDYRCVLIGGGITNRPFFKGMEALKASESSAFSEGSGSLYFNNPDTMPKFSELAAELSKLDKIDAAQLDQAKASFSELSEEDRKANAETLKAIEAKFSEEAQPTEEEKAAALKAEADKKAAEEAEAKAKADAEAAAKADADKAAALQASETADAKIFKETGLTLSEIKAMQKQFSEMEKKQKLAETEKKVDAFVFSETNKEGALLPKAKDRVTQFAAKLPDAMAAEFFEIMASKPFRSFASGEVGQSGNAAQGSAAAAFAVPDSTPKGVSRDSFVLDHVSKAFMAQDKALTYGEAMIKAAVYVRENSVK